MADSKQPEESSSCPQSTETATGDVPHHTSSIVSLNVGGTRFETTRATLTACPGSIFVEIFAGQRAVQRDINNCLFFDRDPTYFPLLLNWLRHHPIGFVPEGLSTEARQALLVEAAFYRLPIELAPRHERPPLYSWAPPGNDAAVTCGYRVCRAEIHGEVKVGFVNSGCAEVAHENLAYRVDHYDELILAPHARLTLVDNDYPFSDPEHAPPGALRVGPRPWYACVAKIDGVPKPASVKGCFAEIPHGASRGITMVALFQWIVISERSLHDSDQ